jgi:hypothetical protein
MLVESHKSLKVYTTGNGLGNSEQYFLYCKAI